MTGARRAGLPGGRMHLQHGPIDLIIEARGEQRAVERAYARAWAQFTLVLDGLVSELPLLRSPLGSDFPPARGSVARRMVAACWPHRQQFITPMAAVAGSVADEILAHMLAEGALRSAYVNDGGDIAIWVAAGETLDAGIVTSTERPVIAATVKLRGPCGLATSGWRGRSQSLGIADAVTVIADNAASADAAATLIANAVDADHPGIRRRPAREVKHDSDLGERLVTVAVDELPAPCAATALDRGLDLAQSMRRAGLIEAAFLALQGRVRVAGLPEWTGCDKLPAVIEMCGDVPRQFTSKGGGTNARHAT